MRLIYYKSQPNVGDALNPWLWSRLIPELLDDDPDHVLLAIGSILTKGYPGNARKITVFGAGARSKRMLPDFDAADWDLRFVRGPRTAAITGAPYISDPAILLPRVLPVDTSRQGLGFIPHFMTRPEVVKDVADQLGARVVHPELGVEDFVAALNTCEEVICEAMHGAIIADAYRIPWAGLRLDVSYKAGQSNVFKWKDYCESIGAPYRFAPLPLSCHLPFSLRKRFRPNSIGALPKSFVYDLSPEARLIAAQDRLFDEIERLKAHARS